MADTGAKLSPKIQKGAFVQLVQDVVGITSNVVGFQYNPATLTHSVEPWNPFSVDQTDRGAQAPTVQPFTPKETFNLTVELDATDDLEDGDPLAVTNGVAHRLAAFQKLVQATRGPIGDLAQSARALAGDVADRATRPTVPVVLFVWGPGRVLPVRITKYEVEESQHRPSLHPSRAKVSLSLEVLTPDVFQCQEDVTAKVAVAAYNATRAQRDALAAANVVNTPEAVLGMLPF